MTSVQTAWQWIVMFSFNAITELIPTLSHMIHNTLILGTNVLIKASYRSTVWIAFYLLGCDLVGNLTSSSLSSNDEKVEDFSVSLSSSSCKVGLWLSNVLSCINNSGEGTRCAPTRLSSHGVPTVLILSWAVLASSTPSSVVEFAVGWLSIS